MEGHVAMQATGVTSRRLHAGMGSRCHIHSNSVEWGHRSRPCCLGKAVIEPPTHTRGSRLSYSCTNGKLPYLVSGGSLQLLSWRPLFGANPEQTSWLVLRYKVSSLSLLYLCTKTPFVRTRYEDNGKKYQSRTAVLAVSEQFRSPTSFLFCSR